MLEFEHKRKFKKRLYSSFTLILLLIILAFVASSTFDIFKKQRMVKHELGSSVMVLQKSKNQKDQLEEEIEKLGSAVGQEEILRSNYALAKDDEEVFVVLDSRPVVGEVIVEKNLWQKSISFFKDLFN